MTNLADLQRRVAEATDIPTPTRDELIALIMRETTDEIVADGWNKLGQPNVLVQGCRFIRGVNGRGYEDPEDAARKFAGFIADALLATLQPSAGASTGEVL